MKNSYKKQWYSKNKTIKELISHVNEGIDYIYENYSYGWWMLSVSIRIYSNGYEVYTNCPAIGYIPKFIGSNMDSTDELGDYIGLYDANSHYKWKSGKNGIEDCRSIINLIYQYAEDVKQREEQWLNDSTPW